MSSEKARFGSMVSNRAGKCHFCQAPLPVGELCGWDNLNSRRVCPTCAEEASGVPLPQPRQKISTEANVAATGELLDRIAKLENENKELHSRLDILHGELDAVTKQIRFRYSEALFQTLRRLAIQILDGGGDLLPHELETLEIKPSDLKK